MRQNNHIETTIISDDFLYTLQQYNLVYNGDFRFFSNKTTDTCGVPDGWIYSNAQTDGSIDFDTDTNQCVLIKKNGDGNLSFKQHIQEFPRWQQRLINQTISAKVYLDINNESEVTVTLSDSINKNSITKKGPGTIIYEVQLTISTNALYVSITIESIADTVTIAISEIYANKGLTAIPNLPCIIQGVIGERKQYIATENAPSGEFSICEPSKELSSHTLVLILY